MFKRKNKKPKPENIKIEWSLYGRIWREIGRPFWKLLAAGILFTIFAAAAEGFTITIVQRVIDQAFIGKSMTYMYMFGLQIIAAFGAKGVFRYSKDLIMAKAGLMAHAALQSKIYDHMVSMNLKKFYGDGIGKTLNYFTVQSGAVLSLVTGTIIELVQNIATLAISLGLMIWYAPQMCAVLLFLVPAIMIPMILIMRRKRRLVQQSFGIANNVTQHLNQTLHGIKTIQAFATEKTESNKFANVVKTSIENAYKNTQASALQSPLLEMMISIGLALALVVGGHFIISGALTTGDFTAFLLALTAAYKPAKSITGTNNSIQHGLLAAKVLFDFLDSKPDIKNKKSAKDLKHAKMSVKFSKVSFEYNPGEPVLKDVSVSARAGSVCALVGPSGGGKTTLFNLLERFYDPKSGIVSINGKNIKDYTLKSLRENIAEVSQDVFLFNDTISANIKYGNPNATDEQVIAAARAANAEEFINKLPARYETSVGERGSLLSGGQKQRIAIARAILKDAPILLLDEATSALDTHSEKLIQSALEKLMKGRTTFVIAHRLSTVLDADMIYVVKNGEIVESGTDAQLCKINGEYKKLRDIQFPDEKPKKVKKK